MFYFSLNTPTNQREFFSNLLLMKVVEKLDNYLGLPLYIGKRKYLPFKDIFNRLSSRINSWSKRLLSYGGKDVFVKFILQALPTYALSIFLGPKGIIEHMNLRIHRMWWASNNKD
ncbi:hypothetical protein V6Z11_A01G173200 [Gossypium hirsutum]